MVESDFPADEDGHECKAGFHVLDLSDRRGYRVHSREGGVLGENDAAKIENCADTRIAGFMNETEQVNVASVAPLAKSLVNRLVERRGDAGTVSGSMNMMGNLAGFVAPMVGGFILKNYNKDYHLFLYVMAGMYVIGAAVWPFIDPETPIDQD